MDEHTENAFRVESDGDAASGSLAVTAAPAKTYHDGVRIPSGWRPGRAPRSPAETSAEAASSTTPDAAREEPDRPDAHVAEVPSEELAAAEPGPMAAPVTAAIGTSALSEAGLSAPEREAALPSLTEFDEATGACVIHLPTAEPASSDLPAAPLSPHVAEAAHFEPIPLRARHDGWTPARQRQFLEELADCGLVGEAAARVGMTRQSAYQLRRRAEGTAFGFAWEAAVLSGMRRIHSIAFERAVEGVVKPVFYHGEKVGEQRVYDTRLLLGLVGRFGNAWSGHRVHDVEKNWDSWLEAVEQGRPEPAPEMERTLDGDGPVWMDEDGIWWTDFPPPDGANVEEHGEWPEEGYQRMLTDEEEAAVEAAEEDRRARALADRDAFFARDK